MAAENAANSHKDRYTSLVMQARLCSTSSFRERMSQNTKTSLFEKCFPARRSSVKHRTWNWKAFVVVLVFVQNDKQQSFNRGSGDRILKLLPRIVVQVLSEPSFDFSYPHSLAFAVVGNLVAVDFAQTEIA